MTPARRMTFQQIADDLAARINSGEYPPHTRLPSNRELADLYSVSMGTVAKVHILLRERRLTYGGARRGCVRRGAGLLKDPHRSTQLSVGFARAICDKRQLIVA